MTTRNEWAALFLSYAGWEPSAEKIDALVAQASKENAGSAWNPLATTEPAPGATDYNAAGVKNYPSEESGLGATLATFVNGHYPQLVAVLSDPGGGNATTGAAAGAGELGHQAGGVVDVADQVDPVAHRGVLPVGGDQGGGEGRRDGAAAQQRGTRPPKTCAVGAAVFLIIF